MAIKCGFYGAECFDLIHYLSRVLFNLNQKVLLVDQSQDRALEFSIPLPSDFKIELDDVIDYRGVDFAGRYIHEYDNNYDYIMIYYGHMGHRLLRSEWMFLVDDMDIRTTVSLKNVLEVSKDIIINTAVFNEKDDGYDSNEPVYITMGPMVKNVGAIQYDIPKQNKEIVEIDTDDLVLKHYCQKDGTFKFAKLSNSYSDLIYRIIENISGNKLGNKIIKKAYRYAERGK